MVRLAHYFTSYSCGYAYGRVPTTKHYIFLWGIPVVIPMACSPLFKLPAIPMVILVVIPVTLPCHASDQLFQVASHVDIPLVCSRPSNYQLFLWLSPCGVFETVHKKSEDKCD